MEIDKSTYIVCFHMQDSATHTDGSDKTSVDVTWQVPGDPMMSNVTLW